MKKLLVDFNMILDIEYGLLKTIKSSFNNTDYFSNLEFIDDNINIKHRIMYRTQDNILSLISTDKTKDQIDDLKKQFIEEEYDAILDNSITTDFKLYLDELIKNKITPDITILCTNKKEESICKKYGYKCMTLIKIDWDYLNKNYDIFYFRYIKFLSDNKCNIQGKIIYSTNSVLNIMNKDAIVSLSLLNANIYKFIDLYNIEKPIGL